MVHKCSILNLSFLWNIDILIQVFIQSLLRGRFLRNERIVVEERPPSVSATELGQLRQRHTVSGLRLAILSCRFHLSHWGTVIILNMKFFCGLITFSSFFSLVLNFLQLMVLLNFIQNVILLCKIVTYVLTINACKLA